MPDLNLLSHISVSSLATFQMSSAIFSPCMEQEKDLVDVLRLIVNFAIYFASL